MIQAPVGVNVGFGKVRVIGTHVVARTGRTWTDGTRSEDDPIAIVFLSENAVVPRRARRNSQDFPVELKRRLSYDPHGFGWQTKPPNHPRGNTRMSEYDKTRKIEQRAYEIWEREGRPDDKSAEHWRRAVAEIEAEETTETSETRETMVNAAENQATDATGVEFGTVETTTFEERAGKAGVEVGAAESPATETTGAEFVIVDRATAESGAPATEKDVESKPTSKRKSASKSDKSGAGGKASAEPRKSSKKKKV